MLQSNASSVKLVSQLATAVAIMFAASACTHEQLKQEADVSAIEDTSTPTPDIETPAADLSAAPTPIPGDVGATAAPKRLVKKTAKHVRHHAKSKRRAASLRKKRKVKTMVANRASVEAQLPPPGPTAAIEDAVIPAPSVVDAAPVLAAPVDLESSGGHGLIISLAILGLGALAFAGVRLRRSRGSRRLVFN